MTISNSTNVAASIISSIAEEANETPSQTKAEAARGDHQAMQKLAHEQALQGGSAQGSLASATGAVAQPPAANGQLNVTA